MTRELEQPGVSTDAICRVRAAGFESGPDDACNVTWITERRTYCLRGGTRPVVRGGVGRAVAAPRDVFLRSRPDMRIETAGLDRHHVDPESRNLFAEGVGRGRQRVLRSLIPTDDRRCRMGEDRRNVHDPSLAVAAHSRKDAARDSHWRDHHYVELRERVGRRDVLDRPCVHVAGVVHDGPYVAVTKRGIARVVVRQIDDQRLDMHPRVAGGLGELGRGLFRTHRSRDVEAKLREVQHTVQADTGVRTGHDDGATHANVLTRPTTVSTVHETCHACGFDGARYDDTELCAAVRELGGQWSDIMRTAGADARTRPAPKVWSALEYAAHSRDITRLHVFGVEQALSGAEPVFDDMDGSALIEDAALSYDELDPDTVVSELASAATTLADTAASASPDAWTRGITIGTNRLDVRRLVEHALHDSVHHLDDVKRGLKELRV